MKVLIVAMLGLLVVEARSFKDAIEVQPDTCTVYGFEIDMFESFELLLDVSDYNCSAADNLMMLSKAFFPGECVLEADYEGCLLGPFDYPSESICNYWEEVQHFPFKGNVNGTLMFVGGGQTCMTKRHYSFGFRSDCDANGTVEFKVVKSVLPEAERERCELKKSDVPVILVFELLALGGGILLCMLVVVIICVCCSCCPCSIKKNEIHKEPVPTLSDLLLSSKKHYDEV
ncbi:hypothetical protein BSKO_08820 [Bryopsis sp. KO-2023]|nr:hypothetical protein BSKO_08820 [Bryopsis sp. KO-2023]